MKKTLGHIAITISGIIVVWLGNGFINADLNPFHYSSIVRGGMIMMYLFWQLVFQLIYSANIYKWL